MLIIDIEAYEQEKERQANEPNYYYDIEFKSHVSDLMKSYYNFLRSHHNYSIDDLVNAFPDDLIEVKKKY